MLTNTRKYELIRRFKDLYLDSKHNPLPLLNWLNTLSEEEFEYLHEMIDKDNKDALVSPDVSTVSKA